MACNRRLVGGSGWGCGGSGWVAGSGLYLTLGHRQQCCVFSKLQKHTQSTGYIG